MYNDTSLEEIEKIIQQAWLAFMEYKTMPLQKRALFMKAIANELLNAGDNLILTAIQETNLPIERLKAEKNRTIYQLNSYAEACINGSWLNASINFPNSSNSLKSDIRKTMIPLGPVVIYGASNFPFAYSTAGGDTACAFAAGCVVIVKAHPAHERTSTLVAELIQKAASKCNMPKAIFNHVYGKSFEVGRALIKHKLVKAVGFTGSFTAGKQLLDWANEREEPIPVFAEMGSINPIFILPNKLEQDIQKLAAMLAISITQNAGQFCTKPGVIISIEGVYFQQFILQLKNEIEKTTSVKMLHAGISEAFKKNKEEAFKQNNVEIVTEINGLTDDLLIANPILATVDAISFMDNNLLQSEVFGPYSILVKCKNILELKEVAKQLRGQLTCSIVATQEELTENRELIEIVQNKCGRMIFNGVPTGVDVCLSMQHGGPYPASTDSRFTAVGADGIKRFARPIAYQNCLNQFLPEELKNENPLNIYRTVNDVLSKDKI